MSFAQPYDFYCLIDESSLILVDRALAAGDVVKRHISDAQSGTVISTSLRCGLRPLCSASEYAEKDLRTAHGVCPAYHEPRERHNRCPPRCLLFGTPNRRQILNEELHDVPASELKYWNQYREDDYIIYRDWIGRIRSVIDEVTVRLNNGSVVVVEDPEELQQPYWIDGSHSSELHKHLFRANYVLNWSKSKLLEDVKAKQWEAQPCYPGQIVQTKKGNLRRGRWKFGAYDPNVTPQGIVVDVRTVQLEVVWLFPNMFKPHRAQKNPPSSILEVDVLESGEVTVYDHSKQPRETSGYHLSGASHSPDIGFGHRVRFRDVAGAAVKYDGLQNNSTSQDTINRFDWIPRTATQGFDMNVLEVTQTQTKVVVKWQDSTVTGEDSVSLVPYNNVDEQEVWPGDYVSLQAEEEVNKDADTITCRKMGVVQSTEATERVAKVRWFAAAIAAVSIEDKTLMVAPTDFGPISDEYSVVSLYDIFAYPAHGRSHGDLLIAVPNPLPPPQTVLPEQPPEVKAILTRIYDDLDRYGQPRFPISRHFYELPSSNDQLTIAREGIDWFGEIVDLDLDGGVIVRLGAASEVCDIKLPFERCVVVASYEYGDGTSDSSEDEESDDEPVRSWRSDYRSDSDIDSTKSGLTIKMEIEYEGGDRMDNESDEEMWTTEDEDQMPDSIPISSKPKADEADPTNTPSGALSENQEDTPSVKSLDLQSAHVEQSDNAATSTAATSKALGSELQLSQYPSMPVQNVLLEESPPADHHFIDSPSNLVAPVLRRIMKEHRIMNSSLPEGVFVQTWESRLDLLRVLIVGPRDTPYELAPFIFDFHFTSDFPEKPPEAYFHSWTDGRGRVNPNLYEDGKICLSLLGTWPGDDGKDTWSAKGSSMLQVIVSLLGLVLVREPYFSKSIPLLFCYNGIVRDMMT